jgi:phospholipase C
MATGGIEVLRKLVIGTAGAALALVALVSVTGAASPRHVADSPIQHVVIIYQENHSFDNVLGAFCLSVSPPRCDGSSTGTLPGGQQIPLGQATDVVASVQHDSKAQTTAIDGGKMDGFANIGGCSQSNHYACYTQFQPSQIPNLAALAQNFVVSDRTFQLNAIQSWGSHIELAAATTDNFTGDNPTGGGGGGGQHQPMKVGPGWGCDSLLNANWIDPNSHKTLSVPSCIPDQNGRGPYKRSPVRYVPTIMDRLDAAGLSWTFYAGDGTKGPNSGYTWQICPTFYECLNSSQHTHVVPEDQVMQAGANGTLPNFSIVLPNSATGQTSQHNNQSMAFGDNYIGQVVSAIENGPDWDSTAIFITYDDCGCFYDHVPPPAGEGMRVPMVIVSPYAKPGFTDSTDATFASMLAFTEHNFGLSPLNSADGSAYDYSNSFNFSQAPRNGIRMVRSTIPRWELRWIASQPPDDDPT